MRVKGLLVIAAAAVLAGAYLTGYWPKLGYVSHRRRKSGL